MGQQLSLVLHLPVPGNQALVSAAHTADGVWSQVNEPEHTPCTLWLQCSLPCAQTTEGADLLPGGEDVIPPGPPPTAGRDHAGHHP